MSTSGPEPRPGAPDEDGGLTWPQYLWAHIGVISGGVLGSILFGFLAFLALIGYRPAIALVVCIVGFVVLIVLGGRFRNAHGR